MPRCLLAFLALLLCPPLRAAPRLHLLTYATPRYRSRRARRQRLLLANDGVRLQRQAHDAPRAARLARSALSKGGFHAARVYTPADLDWLYVQRNAAILKQPKGSGYWVYKPYVLLHYLTQVAEPGDTVVYCDSDYEFTAPLAPFLEPWLAPAPHVVLLDSKPDEGTWLELDWSKRDALVLLNASVPPDTLQAWCGFVALRATFHGVQWAAAWLTYTQDARVVTDEPSTLGKEAAQFVENRHDQTVCSLLRLRWGIPLHRLPGSEVGPLYNWHLRGGKRRKRWPGRHLAGNRTA